MKRVITFLSDFGSNSPYPAAMKAVAAGITNARFVDISHDIRPHDVLEGAFVLWSVAPYFQEGTIHCAVVDPGVGTKRRGLIISTGKQMFVGPDNGLLIPAASAGGILAVYEITNTRFLRTPVSLTFHGRDVFAPVAAHIANGVSPKLIGRPISSWVIPELDFQGGKFLEHEGSFQGQIVYIDRFGNLITNLKAQLISERVDFELELELQVGSHRRRVRLRESYGFAEPGELCLVLGSHGLLEICMREGSAQELLGLKAGEQITIRL